MLDANKKNCRYISATCKAVLANQTNSTGFSLKGINKDSEVLSWVMRHKPGIEKTLLTVSCESWNSEKLHEGDLPLVCVATPWDKEPKEFMFSGKYPLKTNGQFSVSIKAVDAIAVGDIQLILKVREL